MKWLDTKAIIFVLTMIFIAGGAWVTLNATAQTADDLEDRVILVEEKLTGQELMNYQIRNMDARLEKLEDIQLKVMESQQEILANQAAICQQTGARCK